MEKKISRKTFIIDDDPFWTVILTQLLTDLGYTDITVFSNGTDAIKNLTLNPDLIFLDYQMDDMDGLQVLQKIRTYSSEIAVVFCTDQKEISVAVDAMKNGVFEYVVKSKFTINDLSHILKSMETDHIFDGKIF